NSQRIGSIQKPVIEAPVHLPVNLPVSVQYKEIAAPVIDHFPDVASADAVRKILRGKFCRLPGIPRPSVAEYPFSLPASQLFLRRLPGRREKEVVKAVLNNIGSPDNLLDPAAPVNVILFSPNVIHCKD